MKTGTWMGEDRTIPNYGEVTNGSKVTLPDGLAKSFKEQKLFKEGTKTRSKSTDTEEAS